MLIITVWSNNSIFFKLWIVIGIDYIDTLSIQFFTFALFGLRIVKENIIDTGHDLQRPGGGGGPTNNAQLPIHQDPLDWEQEARKPLEMRPGIPVT